MTMPATQEGEPREPRLRVPSQERREDEHGVDPQLMWLAGYLVAAILHGGLDMMLVSTDASTVDQTSAFVVEGKHNRKRYRVSVREMRDVT
jgi:hypothetical protein